jgi:predicted nucleic acid-binding protein
MTRRRTGRTIVPAIERGFSEPLPDHLYVDTDFLIAGLIETEPHHQRAGVLLDRVGEARVRLILSSLTWIEYVNVISKERFRLQLPEEQRRRLRLHRWQDARVRRAYVESMMEAFDATLAQFAVEEVELTSDIRRDAVRFIADYSLGPNDAVHLASAWKARCSDMASFDAGFRRVDDLTLWNDLIHGS